MIPPRRLWPISGLRRSAGDLLHRLRIGKRPRRLQRSPQYGSCGQLPNPGQGETLSASSGGTAAGGLHLVTSPAAALTVSGGTVSNNIARGVSGRADKIAFAGRLSKHKKLAAGDYGVTITATNSSGHATSKAFHFTIAKG
jgi:hypothetical protein